MLLNQKWFGCYYYYCYLFFINIFFSTELINLYSLFSIKQPLIDCFRGDSQAIYYPWSLLPRNSFQGLTIRRSSLTSMVFSSLYYFFNVFSCPTPLNFSSPQSNHFISRPQINPDQSWVSIFLYIVAPKWRNFLFRNVVFQVAPN